MAARQGEGWAAASSASGQCQAAPGAAPPACEPGPLAARLPRRSGGRQWPAGAPGTCPRAPPRRPARSHPRPGTPPAQQPSSRACVCTAGLHASLAAPGVCASPSPKGLPAAAPAPLPQLPHLELLFAEPPLLPPGPLLPGDVGGGHGWKEHGKVQQRGCRQLAAGGGARGVLASWLLGVPPSRQRTLPPLPPPLLPRTRKESFGRQGQALPLDEAQQLVGAPGAHRVRDDLAPGRQGRDTLTAQQVARLLQV